jgi:hypothetical protein
VKIGLIAIAGVKIQTRKFVNLGITLPQFINRGQVVAQLPSLALLSLAGVTPGGVEVAYIEVDDVEAFARDPRLDFDLVALSSKAADRASRSSTEKLSPAAMIWRKLRCRDSTCSPAIPALASPRRPIRPKAASCAGWDLITASLSKPRAAAPGTAARSLT